jgi:radical SAM superfamily enzyme YgiQ (UPF0313 family)
MRVYLVNPSHVSFGTAVITPRWLFVLAGATPARWGDPVVADETLEAFDVERVAPGDIVGIGIHTGNARRGYDVGQRVRERGGWVVYGGIHATLYPDEALEIGGAHAVVKGDGDVVWARVLDDCAAGAPERIYDAGRVAGSSFARARWDLLTHGQYLWASVQTVRGCPKHCSFCSVWRTDGQDPRQPSVDDVVGEVVELRRLGFRFIALADDNFYPVSLADIATAARRGNPARLHALQAVRARRFELLERLAAMPDDMVFFTQITMEAAEDPAFLEAMHAARIRGALVGVESVTEEGLKDVYKGFNLSGDALIDRLQTFKRHDVFVLASFIFGLPSDRASTFDATAALADRAGVTFAQFVTLTPFPGTIDFQRWERESAEAKRVVEGVPVSRYWLLPRSKRPDLNTAHPTMSAEEIRQRTQQVWDRFYALPRIWARAHMLKSMRGRLAFVLISKLYRQMYANTGLTTDSGRTARSARTARVLARLCRRLFLGKPMPGLLADGTVSAAEARVA